MAENYCPQCMNDWAGEYPCKHCGYDGDKILDPHQLPPGTVLNNQYVLGNVIGQGGFGITYIGRDTVLDRRVAIKEYYPNNCATRDTARSYNLTVTGEKQKEQLEKGKQRLLNEAKVLAHNSNVTGVVDVFNYFEENNTSYIVMEYLDGKDLRSVIETEKKLSPDETFRLFLPVIESLEEVHSHNLIHRDISPDNIMQLKNGSLKLMDFGAAREVDYSDGKSKSIILKAGYAPPEQYLSTGSQGPWTDVYALCATMYKCITGRTPTESLQRMEKDTIEWPSEMGIRISPEQEKILKKGMEIARNKRYRRLSELKRDLEDTLAEEVQEPQQEPTRKKKKIIGLVLLAFLIAGGAFGLVRYRSSEQYLQKKVESGEYTHFALSADEDTTLANIAKNEAILRERLELFTGGNNYVLKETNGRNYDIYVPTSSFGKANKEKVIKDVLSTAGKMYFIDQTYSEEQKSPVEIKPEYIESVEEETGTIEGLDNETIQLGESEEYGYLKVRLNKEGQSCYKKVANTFGKIGLAGDIFDRTEGIFSSWNHYYTGCFSDDHDYFYVLNIADDYDFDTYLNLVSYLLENDPMDNHMNYSLEYDVDWEEVDKDSGFQRDVENMDKDDLTYICKLGSAAEKDISEGDRLDAEEAVKKRCDSLHQDYAYGHLSESEDSFALRLPYDHINYEVLQLLPVSRCPMFLSFGNISQSISLMNNITKKQDDEGNYSLLIEITDPEVKTSLDKMVQEEPEARVCFTAGNTRLSFLHGVLQDVYNGKTICLKQSGFSESGQITEDDVWILDFLFALNETNGKLASDYETLLGNGEVLNYQDRLLCPGAAQTIESLEQFVHTIAPEAEVYMTDNIQYNKSCLEMNLHLDVDETLPETALDMAKKIYEHFDLDHSMFNKISIKFMDEEPFHMEKADITFQRNYASVGEEPAKDSASLRCFNGRIDRYKDRFREILESDEFYVKMSDNYINYSSYDGENGWVFSTYLI